MFAFDAVDDSSTGTEVPRMWVLLVLPRFVDLDAEHVRFLGESGHL